MNCKFWIHTAFLGILLVIGVSAVFAGTAMVADKVLVIKSERKMYLLKNGAVFKTYPIMPGQNPVGHKQKKDDDRTPEGEYVLKGRNPESRFHRSIHVSYPNVADEKAARSKGVDPGRYIAIHGLLEKTEEAEWDYIERDWTDGCIAVTNDEIEIIRG